MTLRLFIPIDAAALAVGAGQVASAISAAAARRNVALDIVRTGSRGLYWLEPMVEVETPNGRVAYGPVAPHDAEGLLAALCADGVHKLRLGPTEDIPWLKRQTRLTFARCGIVDPRSLDDYRAHGGGKGLERALSLGAEGIVEEVRAIGPARPRRRWISDRHQVAHGGADAKPGRNTLFVTPTRATAVPSPTA